MKYSFRFVYRLSVMFLAIVLFILALTLALLQTKPMQQYFLTLLETEAKKQGIVLTVKGFSGLAPFKWSLEEAHIYFKEGQEIDLKQAKLRIAFFPLLKRQLSISFFQAKRNIHALCLEEADGKL